MISMNYVYQQFLFVLVFFFLIIKLYLLLIIMYCIIRNYIETYYNKYNYQPHCHAYHDVG